jgi:hypothetical protein
VAALLGGGGSRAAGIVLNAAAWVILEAAAKDEQPSVFAGIEREGRARARPPAETVRLVVIACTFAIE